MPDQPVCMDAFPMAGTTQGQRFDALFEDVVQHLHADFPVTSKDNFTLLFLARCGSRQIFDSCVPRLTDPLAPERFP